MAQVTVNIDGKAYRMACDDGQEAHLESLAAYFDKRIQDMRGSFGEIGDTRLLVMAAITASDEVFDLREKLAAAKAETASVQKALDNVDARYAAKEAKTVASVAAMAEHVEKLTRSLASGAA
jgi:cell division protein ZapA